MDDQDMNKRLASSDDTYKGAPDITIATGRGYLFSWPFGIGSAVLGAAISAFSSRNSDFVTRKGNEVLKIFGVQNPKGKWIVAAGGAFVGWLVGHWVGLGIGIKKSLKNAGAGREQFERVMTQRNELQSRVEQLEIESDSLHERLGHCEGKYSAKTESRLTHGSHAAAQEAQAAREAASPTIH